MDSQSSNSTGSPPSNTPPPPDSASKSPPSSSSPPPPNAPSPPPPNAPSPPPPSASSPPPPSASNPPPPNASSPPPPPPSAPPPPLADPENAPPPPKPPASSPSPPSTSSPSPPSTTKPNQPPPTPSQQSPSPPSQEPPQNPPPPGTPPINLPPVPPSDGNSPPSPPSSGNSSPSGTPPSQLSSGPPSGEQSTPNPVILSPPSGFGPPLAPPGPPVSHHSESKGRANTIEAVVIGLVVLTVFGLASWWLWHRKKKNSPQVHSYVRSESALLKMRYSPANASIGTGYESSSETPVMGNTLYYYSYDELAKVTNEFSESNLLGEGGFGCVFKGLLPDGTEVAVKQLKYGGAQGEREFQAEVETISRIHHRHLVSLVGYCISNEKRLLVYNYMPNNTLHFHLHGQGEFVLDWPTRLKIATGAARGIAYLHEDCHPRIVHRDIKSSNILLDNNFEALVSDFGLARLFSDANTHVTTRVMGTFGYMAPEYASSGKLTEKSDIFSFGVVLLELITGRKPVDASQAPGEESLVEWARPLLKHAQDKEEFDTLIDPRLGGNYVCGELLRVIEAAAGCVRHSASKRPKMSQVVRAIDDMSVSDLTNGMRVGESAIIDTQQSEEMRLFQKMAFSSQDFSTDFFLHGDLKSDEH